MRPSPSSLILASLAACAVPDPGHVQAAGVERTVLTMGTALHVTASGRGAEQAAEHAIHRVQQAERRWSSWLPDSLVSRIHALSSQTKVDVDPEFCSGWQEACLWSERTGGAFDPSIGSLVRYWGIGATNAPATPAPAALEHARSASGLHLLQLEGQAMHRGHPDAQIAEGGFVKGLALDRAIAQAHSAFPHLQGLTLDFGGQLAWQYAAEDTTDARQSLVADPRDRSQVLAAIRLGPAGSLATSGNSERGILIDGQRYSHIVDPRTGATAPDWGSVTVLVLGPGSACAADCLSTALFIHGPVEGLKLAARLPNVEALFLETTRRGLSWHMTDGMRARLTRTNRTLSVPFSHSPK